MNREYIWVVEYRWGGANPGIWDKWMPVPGWYTSRSKARSEMARQRALCWPEWEFRVIKYGRLDV